MFIPLSFYQLTDMTSEDNIRMEPPFLDNQEIIGLLLECFEYHLVAVPSLSRACVTIYVRRADGITGFDFWISLKLADRRENYKGAIFGTDHEVFISEGQREDDQLLPHRSWNHDFSVPVVRVYRYLESIHYFTRTRPDLENPSLLTDGTWSPIFQQNWTTEGSVL